MPLPKLAPPLAPAIDVAAPAGGPVNAVRADASWLVLRGLGLALALVGGVDLALNWYPLGFSSPEWEFGTITATFDGLPVATVGLGLLYASAVRPGSPRLRRGIRIVAGALGLALIAAALLYASLIPVALRGIPDPALQLGLYRAIAKTAVQAVAYPAFFLWIALRRVA